MQTDSGCESQLANCLSSISTQVRHMMLIHQQYGRQKTFGIFFARRQQDA